MTDQPVFLPVKYAKKLSLLSLCNFKPFGCGCGCFLADRKAGCSVERGTSLNQKGESVYISQRFIRDWISNLYLFTTPLLL